MARYQHLRHKSDFLRVGLITLMCKIFVDTRSMRK